MWEKATQHCAETRLLDLALLLTCENLCPCGLLCVISELLAAGSPGFRTVLCWFFSHINRMATCVVLCSVVFFSRHTNSPDDAQVIISNRAGQVNLHRPVCVFCVWLVFVFVVFLVFSLVVFCFSFCT
jgi:hypothetical protein